jgi:Fic family protein
MSFQNKLNKIDQLRENIESFGTLGKEVLNKINYKFRLDWNYYSNRMEGNTLTIEETKSVMVGNITIQNKPIKDVLEMQGHDKAIQLILKMGKGELNISESRIRDLHKAIMCEENPSENEKIGKWKAQPNHVFNYKGEKFDFIPPEEVQEKMHELINWINNEKEKITARAKGASHPVQLAFEFHLRYLTIHPFYDGNGRTGRILTNLILISYGYPPIYVKDEDKITYYRYLADVQAYGSDKLMFYEILADYLLRSLNIVKDAVEGKEIEEPGDLDKKIQLLEMELNTISPDDEVKMKFGKEAFLFSYETWITKLISYAVPIIQKFNNFFTGTNHYISVDHGNVRLNFSDESVTTITEKLTDEINREINRIGQARPEFRIQTFYGPLRKGGLKTFGCNYSLLIRFDDIKYEVFVDDFDESTEKRVETKMYERLFHQALTDKEMKDASQMLGNTIFKHIDYNTKKIGLRK